MEVPTKVLNAIGKEAKTEMDAMGDDDLKKVIVQAESAMKTVVDELNANKTYTKLKEDKKDLEQGKNSVFKRQKAKIQYALHRLEERGKA